MYVKALGSIHSMVGAGGEIFHIVVGNIKAITKIRYLELKYFPNLPNTA